MSLKVVCAWCGKVLKEGDEAEGISHGICPHCLRVQVIEDVIADEVEAEAIAVFGLAETDFSGAFQFVLRDGTMIGGDDWEHYNACGIDEVLEHGLLTVYEGLIHDERPMTLKEARAKWPGMNNGEIADRRWSDEAIDICPKSLMIITGAARTGEIFGTPGRYFTFVGLPTLAQAVVMERWLKEEGFIDVEIDREINRVWLRFDKPVPAAGILAQLERAMLAPPPVHGVPHLNGGLGGDLAGTTGKVPNLTSPKELEEKAVEEFGVTENPLVAGYILKDGRFLDFSRGGPVRASDHRKVVGLFSDEEVEYVKSQYQYKTLLVHEFMARTGAIRVHPETCAIESPVVFPTRDQARSINDLALVCKGTVLMDMWKLGNPQARLTGYFTAGSTEDLLRVAKMMEEHPERFEKPAKFLFGKADWGLKGLHEDLATHLQDGLREKADRTDKIEETLFILTEGTKVGIPGSKSFSHLDLLFNVFGTSLLMSSVEFVQRSKVVRVHTVSTIKGTLAVFRDLSYEAACMPSPAQLKVMIDEYFSFAGQPDQPFRLEFVVGKERILFESTLPSEKEIRQFFNRHVRPEMERPGQQAGITEGLHGLPHGNGGPRDLHPLEVKLKDRAKTGSTMSGAAFILSDGTLIMFEDDASGHVGILDKYFDDEELDALDFFDGTAFSKETGAIRTAVGFVGGKYIGYCWPTPAQVKAMLDAFYLEGFTYGMNETLELVIFTGEAEQFFTYNVSQPSEKSLRFFLNKVCGGGCEGLHGLPLAATKDLAVLTAGMATTTDPARAGFVLPDGTLLDIYDGLRRRAHREISEQAGASSLNRWMIETGAIRLAVPGTIEIVTTPTETQYRFFEEVWAAIAGILGERASMASLVFVDWATGTPSYRYVRTSALEIAGGFLRDFVRGKVRGRGGHGVPHLEGFPFLEGWVEEIKRSFGKVENPWESFWIAPDGELLNAKDAHPDICWKLEDDELRSAIRAQMMEDYHYADAVEKLKQAWPEHKNDEEFLRNRFEEEIGHDARNWCETIFMKETGAIRHATAQYPESFASFNAFSMPTLAQAAKMAAIIEQKRPRWTDGDMDIEFTEGRYVRVAFPARATASAVIAKIERALEEREAWLSIPPLLGQLPQVGAGDGPAELAVKTVGLAGALEQGHGLPHLGRVGLAGMGSLPGDFTETWVNELGHSFDKVQTTAEAHWILPDGKMFETESSHHVVCWGIYDNAIITALEEEILTESGFYDDLEAALAEDPSADEDELKKETLRQLHESGAAKDWCEGLFITLTRSVRHASQAFGIDVPSFEGSIPTMAQAKQIAEEIEARRPRHAGQMDYLYTDTGRFLKLEFPAKATAASVIAKIERALDNPQATTLDGPGCQGPCCWLPHMEA